MKRIILGISLIVGGTLIGIAAKDYAPFIGRVDKAQLQRFMVTIEKRNFHADCYWNFINPEGIVIVENKKTSVNKALTNAPTLKMLGLFVNGELTDHIKNVVLDVSGSVVGTNSEM